MAPDHLNPSRGSEAASIACPATTIPALSGDKPASGRRRVTPVWPTALPVGLARPVPPGGRRLPHPAPTFRQTFPASAVRPSPVLRESALPPRKAFGLNQQSGFQANMLCFFSLRRNTKREDEEASVVECIEGVPP